MYLGSNLLVYNDSSVKTIAIGEDKNWSHGLLKILELTDTPYVSLMLDDFFLRRPVNTNHVLRCIKALKDLNGQMLRLIPRPLPDKPVRAYPFLSHVKPTSLYRVSTQGTLWRKAALISLIGDGENIWEFGCRVYDVSTSRLGKARTNDQNIVKI